MTNMTTILKAAKENMGEKFYGWASEETEHGLIRCNVQITSGQHRAFRRNWYLNHKPMSAKKMEALIGA